jgi:hypothetical protein
VFHVPSGHKFQTTGTLQVWTGSSWTSPPADLGVDIQYRYAGSSTWHSAGTAKTDHTGYFASTHELSASGIVYWRVWLPRTSDGNIYATSADVTATSRVVK